tara:strand:- start:1916 stop:2056 length:141 start_codon:yes stop_codon:yes gene_type:complete
MYNIIGISRFGEEIIDTADSRSEAMELVGEYQLAFGNDFIIKFKRK